MADVLDPENAAFWLPASFLTDDEDNDENNNTCIVNNNDDFFFGSSIDSPLSSTETELGDASITNDDELVNELTRHLANSSLHDSSNEKPWSLSTSPQSTLTGFGPFSARSGFSSNNSPNGPSPPLTPPSKNDAAWQLLYEAASQVARLKINALAAEINHHQNHRYNNHHHLQQNRGLLGAPRNVSLSSKPFHHHNTLYDFPQYEQVKSQRHMNFYCNHQNQQRRSHNGGPVGGLPSTTWPPLRPNHHHPRQPSGGPGMRSMYLNGPGAMKRQSTGTGVFLPRRAGAGTTTQQQPTEPRKKQPTGTASMWLPEVEEVNHGGVNANLRARFAAGMLSEQEIIMARRNAIVEQQRRNLMRSDEIRLPNDWTY